MNETFRKWLARRRAKIKPDFDLFMQFYPLTLDELPGEIWLPVPDFEDYQASNFGRVKSFKLSITRILKPRLSAKGYFRFNLSKGNQKKDFWAHQLVARLFIPNPEGKKQVNHIDGVKFNNHVSNLEWCTNDENRAHAVANDLHSSGEDDPRAKLTNEQVKFIRANPDSLTTIELGKMFGVSPAAIVCVQTNKTYRKAGGTIRKARSCKYTPRLPDNIRNQIRAEYVWHSSEYGSYALAKKYGVTQTTIRRILRED